MKGNNGNARGGAETKYASKKRAFILEGDRRNILRGNICEGMLNSEILKLIRKYRLFIALNKSYHTNKLICSIFCCCQIIQAWIKT